MHTPTVEERIRTRAYELWQEDGSMEGCADEYWRRARTLVEAELAAEQREQEGRLDATSDNGKTKKQGNAVDD